MRQLKKMLSTLCALALLSALVLIPGAFAELAFAGGAGTAEDPWQVATAEQFDLIRADLDAHYILVEDIDLSGFENFTPIGAFEPASDAPEDEENPNLDAAFTGTLDGQGHKISNLTISAPDTASVGLFGVVGGEGYVANLTLENVTVQGQTLVGGLIGFAQTAAAIENVTMTGKNLVTGVSMVGGLIGGAFSDVKDCSVIADVVMTGDDAQGAGVIVGGTENGGYFSCAATGTVTALGANVFSVGGLSGCAQASLTVSDCTADVVIATGAGAAMVGGLLGHAGNYDGAVTAISDCAVNAEITVGEGSERIGGIVGGGFYMSLYTAYFAAPGDFSVEGCTAAGSISGGAAAGAIAGYLYGASSVADDCVGTVTVAGEAAALVGATAETLPLDQLR